MGQRGKYALQHFLAMQTLISAFIPLLAAACCLGMISPELRGRDGALLLRSHFGETVRSMMSVRERKKGCGTPKQRDF